MRNLKSLQKRLNKVELELDKCRTSTFMDGWQTMFYAKKSRKWDFYAEEKRLLISQIEEEKKWNLINDSLPEFHKCVSLRLKTMQIIDGWMGSDENKLVFIKDNTNITYKKRHVHSWKIKE